MIGSFDIKYDKEAYLLHQKLEGDKQEKFFMDYSENKKSYTCSRLELGIK